MRFAFVFPALVFSLWLVCVSSASLKAQEPDEGEMVPLVVFGTVFSESEPVDNAQITFYFTKIVTTESGFEELERDRVSELTDEEGKFLISLKVGRDWIDAEGAEFVLSVNSLDWSRYRKPRDKILTDLIKSSLESEEVRIETNFIVENRPRWNDLKREFDKHGENTDKGKLLRRYGMPDKVEIFEREGKAGSIWYYFKLVPLDPMDAPENEGLAIRFIEDKEEKRFRLATKKNRPSSNR